eukprot:TRINITY_DN22722_c0_g3_i2.p1 TRINITY_DN22722_c0_g3~~TRINITY_DN22722_c0_g3_i2.p1  ORF type:complete len:307 (+),score=76.24 TRINITY_DN22722_c0_g3_i2:73-921(+)
MAGLAVFVRGPAGELTAVEVSPQASLGDLRDALRASAAPGLAAARLSFAGAELHGDGTLLCDAGVGQEAVLDATIAFEPISWARVHASMELRDGGSGVRTGQGGSGKLALGGPPMETGRHLWALRVHIPGHKSSNFTVGLAAHDLELRGDLYPRQQACGVLDHSDCYCGGKSHMPRRGYWPNDLLVCVLDMDRRTFEMWRELGGQPSFSDSGEDESALRSTEHADQIAAFDIPSQGAQCPAFSSLTDGEYGADFVDPPGWVSEILDAPCTSHGPRAAARPQG